MAQLQFEKKIVTAKIRNPLQNFQLTEEQIEIRTDPLTGAKMRISKPKGLDKIPEGDPLNEFAANSPSCFFCAGRVENQTPMLPEDIYPEGRIRMGEALLFPNLSGYARYSGVCIFSGLHFIAIQDFTPQLIMNALLACQTYFRVCAEKDKDTLYPTINMNYLLPAGSSILHPHLQPYMDTTPTNLHQRIMEGADQYFQRTGSDFWHNLKESERNGSRFLFEDAHSFWFTPFAPSGFNEINALIGTGEPFTEFNTAMLSELAEGIYKVLQFYHHIRHNSFNLVLFSSPVNSNGRNRPLPGVLKIATRPVFAAHYRNDVTFFEKFHEETMIDQWPEDVAEKFRAYNS